MAKAEEGEIRFTGNTNTEQAKPDTQTDNQSNINLSQRYFAGEGKTKCNQWDDQSEIVSKTSAPCNCHSVAAVENNWPLNFNSKFMMAI